MYFRKKKSPSGETLQLLESYRNREGCSRNRVVVSLGSLKLLLPEEKQRQLARLIESRLYGQEELFSGDRHMADLADQVLKRVEREGRWSPFLKSDTHADEMNILDGVIRNGITHRHATSLGSELIGLHVWKRLKLDSLLRSLKFNNTQIRNACALILSRLISPGSELGIQRFLDSSSLPDLLNCNFTGRGDLERFYRTGDKLLKYQNQVETHLRNVLQVELNLERTYYLYDLTNTHFEGICAGNPKALRGKNKQKRNDCPQVAAGLCFDEYGFVLFHKMFAGNTSDSTTLKEMIDQMDACSSENNLLNRNSPVTIIIDGGIGTEKNLQLLKSRGLHYLVNRTRQYRNHYVEYFKEKDKFEPITGRSEEMKVYARKIIGFNDDELILCRSEKRKDKEKAIRSGAEEKFLADMEKFGQRIMNGKLKLHHRINEAIGRLKERHGRVSRYYNISYDDENKVLGWRRNDDKYQDAELLDGCYVLQSNARNLTSDQLWHRYMTLTTAEKGFRILKSDLGLRPNYHSREGRVDGHVFITILAYQILRFITWQLELKGERRSWPVIRQVLQTHTYATIDIPTTKGVVFRERKAGKPEERQKEIYHLLGVNYNNLPQKQAKIPTTL